MERFSPDRLRVHALTWTRTWVPWCVHHNIRDPFAYDLHMGVECLCAVQDLTHANAELADKAEQHATFKAARAAMSAVWAIACPGTNFAEESAVKAVAVGLRREAPNLARYEDTWDVNLVFDRIFALAEARTPIIALPHAKKRAWAALLLKLKTKCRTGDLAPNKHGRGGVFRRYVQQDKQLYGLQGDYLAGTVKSLRFYMNKTTISRPSLFSKWHQLGDYLRSTDEFPHLADACPRALFETYLEETDGLPRADHFAFVSSTRTKAGKHSGISASRLANCIVGLLRECGVPERFKGHSTRHATLSAGAADPLSDLDNMLSTADLSAKVFRLYYSRSIAEDAKSAQAERQSTRALAEMFGGHQSQHRKWVRAGSEADKGAAAAAVKAGSKPSPPVDLSPDVKTATSSKAKTKPPRRTRATSSKRAGLEEEEFEVEAILDSRYDLSLRVKVFAVKWVGFEELTWEPRAHLGNAKALLQAFERSRSKLKLKAPTIRHVVREKPADPSTGRPAQRAVVMRRRALKSQGYFKALPKAQRAALLKATPSDVDARVVPGPRLGGRDWPGVPVSTVEPAVPPKVPVSVPTPTSVVESPTGADEVFEPPNKMRRVARGSVRAAALRPQVVLGGLSLLQVLHGKPVKSAEGRTPLISRLVRAKPPPRAEDQGAWFGTGVPQPDLSRGRRGARAPTPTRPASSLSETAGTPGVVSPLAPVSDDNGTPKESTA